MIQTRTAVLATVALLMAMSGAGPAMADEDEDVAVRAAQALVAARLPGAQNVLVTSFNGEVDLEGSVPSRRARQEAARLLQGQPGVISVHNDLQVNPDSRGFDPDQAISHRVEKALHAAGFGTVAGIEVHTFNHEVDLYGVVSSDAERRRNPGGWRNPRCRRSSRWPVGSIECSFSRRPAYFI